MPYKDIKAKRAYEEAHRKEAAARAKAWVEAHPEQAKATHHAYYLAHKDTWNITTKLDKDRINARRRELRALPENKARKRAQDKAYLATHAESVKTYQQAYTQEHIEKIKARVKAWNKAHPEQRRNQELLRKARKQGGVATLSDAQWREIKEHYGYRCVYCGRKMTRLTKDHITPFINNGDHHLHNVVPACQSCNSRKGKGKPLVPVQPMLLTIAPEQKKRRTS